MKIVLIFNNKYNCTIGQYILKEFKKENEVYVFSSRDNFQGIYELKPDFILAIDDGSHYILDINYHTKAIWIVDSHTSFICDKIMIKSFDIIFVAQKEYVDSFKKVNKNVYWLPLGCDQDWHGKQNLEKIYDIAFVGQLGVGWRKKMLLNLRKDFSNNFIKLADCKDLGKIYSQAKIVINYNVNNDINMRVFEALCSGSLLITNKINDNGFEELFKDGEHLVVYDGTYKDLKEKIKYYLENDKERNKIAEQGRKIVLENHTYKKRIEDIIKIVLESKKIFFNFSNYSNSYYNFLKIKLFFRFLFWKLIYLRIWRIFMRVYAFLFFK